MYFIIFKYNKMMKELNYKNIEYLPDELVDMIVDYLDYEKYCKPQHYENLKGVINDIGDMASIQSIDERLLSSSIAIQCWGTRGILEPYFDEESDYENSGDDSM